MCVYSFSDSKYRRNGVRSPTVFKMVKLIVMRDTVDPSPSYYGVENLGRWVFTVLRGIQNTRSFSVYPYGFQKGLQIFLHLLLFHNIIEGVVY